MSDQSENGQGPTPQVTAKQQFLPFVGFETPDGRIILRRWDLIRGFETRASLNDGDGCEVLIAGEKSIIAKTSLNAIIAQVRAAEHWSQVRQVQESFAIQTQLNDRANSSIMVPR